MKTPFLRRLFFAVIGLVVPWALRAQDVFSCRTIGINQGLSQSSVMDVAFDSLGFAWFATQDGLNRYDGRNFLIYPKTFDDITTPVGSRLGKLVAGEKGRIWLVTSGGKLEKMDLHTLKSDMIGTLPGTHRAMPSVNCVFEDRGGRCWVGTESAGLLCLDETGALSVPALPSPSVQQITQDRQGNYWVLTRNGVVRFGGTSPFRTYLQTAPARNAEAITCSAMSQDGAGNYWLGTYGNGMYYMGKDDSLFRPFVGSTDRIGQDLIVLSLITDRSGNTWIGTYGNGLYRIDAQHRVHQYLSDKKDPFSLPYNDILCLREDAGGGIWIGTDGGGVAQYNARFNNFTILSRDNVPNYMPIEQVRAICTDRAGGVWVGTSNNGLGYVSKDLGSFKSFVVPSPGPASSNYQRIVSLLADEEDDIWVGTQGNGYVILDKRSRTIKRPSNSGAGGATIWCMLADSTGRAWAGTRNGGLCLIDKNKGLLACLDTASADAQRLPDNNIRALARVDDHTICIGTDKKGIRFLDTRSRVVSREDPLPASPDGPFILKCLYYHAPWLYIGTQGKGFCIYNRQTGASIWVTEKDGLPNNTIYGIQEDSYGRLWMSTNKGLCMYAPGPDPVRDTGRSFSIFTREDGLQSNEFNTGAWHKASDGRLFFGGISGLTLFYPQKLVLTGSQPRVAITGIMVNNSPLPGDTAIPYKRRIDLSYGRNSLSFNFAALDFLTNNKIGYAYRLAPYESKWIPSGNRGYTAYTNLAPGSYVFQVKANSSFSRDPERITSLIIVIHPPFWKTAWFIVCCVLLVVLLLAGLYQYRINQLLRVQHIRNRIATDLHDDIGSTLTNISLLSELTRKNQQMGSDTTPFLDRIAEEVQRSSQALDDIVWSINTNNDSMEQVVARMRRYASEIFDGANIRYVFDADIGDAQKRLNIEQRRDCFLIFKEVINNIYKHAEASIVEIDIDLHSNHLDITITDDGKGFDIAAITHRNGLKNIRQRVEKWRGKLDIRSAPGSGSTVDIGIPLR